MKFDIITSFPGIIESYTQEGILGRAQRNNIADINAINLRDFSNDKFGHIDDTPYGGGPGMILRCEPAFSAINQALSKSASVKRPRLIYTSPVGKTFNQEYAEDLSFEEHIIILCGRYEGIDQRIIDHFQFEEISLGDFIITGGELVALSICDAAIRLIPDVLGDDDSSLDESFSSGLLEYPHFTKPREYMGMSVPDVLTSGNHQHINRWRREQMIKRTFERRPDLLKIAPLSKADKLFLQKLQSEDKEDNNEPAYPTN